MKKRISENTYKRLTSISRATVRSARGSIQLLTMLCCLCLSSASLATSSKDILNHLILPTESSLAIVSDNIVHNGIAIAIGEFSSSLSADEVLSFYRQRWAKGGVSGINEIDEIENLPGFNESSMVGWLMISRLQDEHQILVQLSTEQTNGSSGFVSIMPLRASPPSLQSQNQSVFSELSLLSNNASQDGADRSLMQVFSSPSSVSATHVRYRDKLTGQGWRVLMDEAVDNGKIMILARDQSRLELSFLASPEYASVLVAHEVESR